MQHDSFTPLDEISLAELDDMLPFETTQFVGVFPMMEDAMDEFEMMLTLEIPSLTDERSTMGTKVNAAKSSTLSQWSSGKRPRIMPFINDKDVRFVPYSKTKKSCCRKRPNDELNYLRTKIGDMEVKLQSLQTTSKVESPAAISATVVYGSESWCSQSVLNWRSAAEHEKKKAAHSIVENTRLRTILNDNMKAAKAAIDQHIRKMALLCSETKMEMAAFDNVLPCPKSLCLQ